MTDRVVRVLPDVPAIDRAFDYRLPGSMADAVGVGTMVRVGLSGRRVGGWVVDDVVDEPAVARLSEVQKVTGTGPSAEVIDLCRWAAWRWAGRLATFLRLASPPRAVASVPRRPDPPGTPRIDGAARDAVAALGLSSDDPGAGVHVLEIAPTTDPGVVLGSLVHLGQLIVVVPSVRGGAALAAGLGRAGTRVARWPDGWAAAAAGDTVVGGRSAVFARAPGLGAIVVIDEHDEALQSESSPTWHAREVAVERARRAGVPCVLVSPCPSLEALLAQDPEAAERWREPPSLPLQPPSAGPRVPAPRQRVHVAERRSGWAPTTVVDRRGEDGGRVGLYTSQLVEAVRSTARAGGRAVCVLNRTGRARLLACRSCGTMAECAVCHAAVRQDDDRHLSCGRCGARRPPVCTECGSSAFALLRLGVGRAREELEALAREPVGAVTASGAAGAGTADDGSVGTERVLIGTEAVLHRVPASDLVAFVDLDQELLAPRYRAAEETLALLVLANRQLGGRSRGGRLLVQTRLPHHAVVRAALRADPSLVGEEEGPRRRLLRFPPAATVVEVGGEAAGEYLERVGTPLGVVVQGPMDDRWLLRSDDGPSLLDHLARVSRPPGRLRLRVDPARIG